MDFPAIIIDAQRKAAEAIGLNVPGWSSVGVVISDPLNLGKCGTPSEVIGVGLGFSGEIRKPHALMDDRIPEREPKENLCSDGSKKTGCKQQLFGVNLDGLAFGFSKRQFALCSP